jgi:pimeloyl-ACP methyl ester carboxylesterase
MGGLVAMGVALAEPAAVAGIAVLDIAPRPYPVDNERELAAMSMDLSRCETRADLDRLLLPILPDARTRQFILTNAVRGEAGFRWRLNVEALRRNTVADDFAREAGSSPTDALLVASGKSSYVTEEDHALMRRYFPRARIELIPEADHWQHVSAPAALESLLRRFLSGAMQ